MVSRGQISLPQPAPKRPGTREKPLSVGQLVRGASRVLDRHVGTIWVEGEVASLSPSARGHVYFALRDGGAQVRVVIWQADAQAIKFKLENGIRIVCRGQVNIYEREGSFQMYAKVVEPAGLGAEALALKQLKEKLTKEGLFAQERKRPLPKIPKRIGVVTSQHGAAVRDIVRAVQRRFPVPILVADAQVQGAFAPEQIVRGLSDLGRTDCDVIIVGRGGGAASDLAAFNDEKVVRAIAACPVPTISAVGHEVDVTLSDLVADRRAATPTMAGEMAVPVQEELRAVLSDEERRARREIELLLASRRQDIDHAREAATSRLAAFIAKWRRVLTEEERRVTRCHPRVKLNGARRELDELASRLHGLIDLRDRRSEVTGLLGRLDVAASRSVERRGRELAELASKLDALSPLRVLDRGFALATHENGEVVRAARELAPGDVIRVRLAKGAVRAAVDAVEDEA